MTTRSEAFSRPFPAGPEWVAAVRTRLGLDGGDGERVRAIAQGWMRLGSTQDAVLVDTLFVLTTDQLGFGQTKFDTTDPSWVSLSSIQAMDLIEGVPYPLEPIEVQFVGGLAIFVGWPEDFTTAVVTALRVHGSARRQPPPTDGPVMPPLFSTASTPQPPLAPSGVRSAADRATPPDVQHEAASAADAQNEDEQPEGEQPEGEHPDGEQPDGEQASSDVIEPLDAITPSESPSTSGTGQVSAEEAFFGHLEPEEIEGTNDMFSVSPTTLDADLPAVPEDAAEVPGPWDDPAIAWPEGFRECAFLGGHPVHQRRRKNCTVVLTRRGLVAATSGFSPWRLHVPWHEVARLDVQGSDEIKFTHNQRVGANSGVLVIDLVDGSTLLFEVRAKRPATLRSLVAPIQAAVNRPRDEPTAGAGPDPSAERDAS